jgi:hypothetical protein
MLTLYIYCDSVHVSSNLVLIISTVNCINTTSGIYFFYIHGNVHR